MKTFRHKKGSNALKDYLRDSETDLRVTNAFNIVYHLSANLVYLHKQELVHGNISAESIEISLNNDRVTDAAFSMDHDQVPEDSGQLNDIYDLGMVVKVLLRNIKLP
ncbi:uncharacterized protein LOC117315750 [Pecten maximus]|uniref:uncharacterized protein LOC117315750 n=1 Tax=Pecten maximus TaxID=6579 RepID=UPI0014588775|nr:uncharacterized protein LOC117315750 [Pecten maximus]